MQGKAKPTTQRGKLCALSAAVLGGLLILVSLALLKERLIEWWYRVPISEDVRVLLSNRVSFVAP